jgi:hypothetical protein
MMNKSTSQRAEEARRQAQVALSEARRRQDEELQERASMRALEVRKIESLRAQRLAAADKIPVAEDKPLMVKRKQLRAA